MSKKKTQEEVIAGFKKIHGDKFDYSEVVYTGTHGKVWIKCKACGYRFQMTPHHHLSGQGCPSCSGRRQLSQEEFIEQVRALYGDDLDDYSKVVYINTKTEITLHCKKHDVDYKTTPERYLQGHRCKLCGYEKVADKRRTGTEKFIEQARALYGDDLDDYSKVNYVNWRTKVTIHCKKHDIDYEVRPDHYLYGHRCQKCGWEKQASQQVMTYEYFIKKAKEIHGDQDDFSLVKWKDASTKIKLKCKKHGIIYEIKPLKYLQGQRCNLCGNERIADKLRKTVGAFIEQAKHVHGDKYDYGEVEYRNNSEPVKIFCKKCKKYFMQRPSDHLRGNGCPQCAKHMSKQEEEVASYVASLIGEENVQRNVRNIISPKELDIYIPSLSLAIEYNGIIWHSDKFQENNNYHVEKLDACNAKGIKLIQIFEDEWRLRGDTVKSKLRHLLGMDGELTKIPARKCDIREIDKDNANEFLERWHIQGGCGCTVALGCFYQDELIAVMTFKREHKDGDTWELTRFASSPDVICQGCGGKLFKHFLRLYEPSEVKSFADRRWTINKENNLYTKLGFELVRILPPDYHYLVGNKRKHKFGFRKQKLSKLYNLPLTMTEREMTDILGFKRIYDCGLYKYVWKIH